MTDDNVGSFRPTNALSTPSLPSHGRKGGSESINSELKAFNPNKSFNFGRSVPSTEREEAVVPSTNIAKKRKASDVDLHHDSNATEGRQTKVAKVTTAPGQPSRRKRKTKGPPIQQRTIPRSFEECDKADQLLIMLRDEGAEWEEVMIKWKALTGEQKVGKSTLPNRYNRLKENFSVVPDEDSARLIEAKREIEDAVQRTKWAKIAILVRRKGGDEYSPIVLQRHYKKLMLGVGACPPLGVRDPDFDGVDPLPPSPNPHHDGSGGGRSRQTGAEVSDGTEGEAEEEDEDEESDG